MSSSSPAIDVSYVAQLARIQLTEEEVATFSKQLGDVLDYVQQLQSADISQVQLAGEETDFVNNLRADIEQESLPTRLALRTAPSQANDLITVPRMVE